MVAWETEKRSVTRYDQQKLLTEARKKYDDFRAVPQDFQVSALKRTDKGFTAFYRRCENGDAQKEFPRYRRRVRSLTWCLRKNQKSERQNPITETAYRHNRLKVPKLGDVKIYMHRPLQGDPKEVTIIKKASGWYAHISCDIGETAKVAPTAAIAIDMGTTHYLTTSEGEKVDNPRWYRHAEGLLHKHSQTQARRQKGGQRWSKAVHAVALHHERTANKRKDFIGKLVYKLYHHYKNNVLVAEDLGVSNMVKNKHLSKSISDASWATFFEWCGNMVSERDGFHFHQVDPKYTSQDCSCCGQRSPKNFLWRYAPLTVSFVASRLTETTTLHAIYFIGQLLPFVESVGLPTSMKRETLTKQKTLEALRTQSSYRCLMLGQAQVFRLG